MTAGASFAGDPFGDALERVVDEGELAGPGFRTGTVADATICH